MIIASALCAHLCQYFVQHTALRLVKPHLFCLDRCVFIATNISSCGTAYKYFPTDTIKNQ